MNDAICVDKGNPVESRPTRYWVAPEWVIPEGLTVISIQRGGPTSTRTERRPT